MRMYVVYENPSDFPGRFVVREWRVGPGSLEAHPEPLAVTDSLKEARAAIPPGLFPLARFSEDDPAVKEVWL